MIGWMMMGLRKQEEILGIDIFVDLTWTIGGHEAAAHCPHINEHESKRQQGRGPTPPPALFEGPIQDNYCSLSLYSEESSLQTDKLATTESSVIFLAFTF